MTTLELDLALHPDDATRLARAPGLTGSADGTARAPRAPSRPQPLHVIWHDTPDGALAADGLALAERREGRVTRWRLERMLPAEDSIWVPGTPAPVLGEAADPTSLGLRLSSPLMPIAGFDGATRALPSAPGDAEGEVSVTLTQGVVRAIVGEHPVCRVRLAGETAAVGRLARDLAGDLRLSVPPAALAAEAYETARPRPLSRRLGAPALPAGLPTGVAFAYVAAHLASVILHYAGPAAAGVAPEPVHQMRVATRRLRSAISLFRRAVGCPELDAARDELRGLGAVLGPARDWDVFASGTARLIGETFPDDVSVKRLVRHATKRRDACYAALREWLSGPEYRRLGLTLATLAAARPWERSAEADESAAAPASADGAAPPVAELEPKPTDRLEDDLTGYAARALTRRMRKITAVGDDVADLPVEALHAIRLDAKRLRYAGEFFAPLFPGRDTRRFIRRVADLQEALGVLNDGSVASGLLAEIGQSRVHAGGIVRGWIAAQSSEARADIEANWKRLLKQDTFW